VETPGQAPQHSSGRWRLASDGGLCVQVEQPLKQEMALTNQELRLWFPDRKVLMRQAVAKDHPAPLFDAVVAGLVDATRTLPAGAELFSQQRTLDGQLRAAWRVRDRGGQVVSELTTIETKAGVIAVDLSDGEHRVLRSYRFGTRERVGTWNLPGRIDATYRTAKGVTTRTEHWLLRRPVRLPPGLLGPCARPTGPYQEKPL
jgi:hypothetical protein